MKKTVGILMLAAMVLMAGCGGGSSSSSSSDNKTASKGEKQVLNIYSWTDYYAPEVLADFEKENNCN